MYADFVPFFAVREGDGAVIATPAGEGRAGFVSRDDLADVATVVLLRDDAELDGQALEVTGPEALTLAEVAVRAGAALGRPLSFEDETVEQAYASRRAAYEAEDWQLDAWVSTYTAIRDGSCSEVTDDVERVSGHPARTLEEALQESPRR